MRLIIILLCLCSGVSLIAYSRSGFPEDPLRILGPPRAVAEREAKDQARFAHRFAPPDTSGTAAIHEAATRDALTHDTHDAVVADDGARTASIAEPARAETPAETPMLPISAPAPVEKVEPIGEHQSSAARARLLVRTARMTV